VEAETGLWVADMVAQRGMKAGPEGPPIRYVGLRECLGKLAGDATRPWASVRMPRIGCGLAGGQWEEVEPIVLDELVARGVEVAVYDFG
jgi:O-acetyl-ADP-ribose deacetylase (regulator of RNase III)